METRRYTSSAQVNYWQLVPVVLGCCAAIAIALFVVMVNEHKATEDENQRSEEKHFLVKEIARSQPQPMEQIRWVSMPERKPVPSGYRCIKGQLFHMLPNEIDQVTDGSASTYCR